MNKNIMFASMITYLLFCTFIWSDLEAQISSNKTIFFVCNSKAVESKKADSFTQEGENELPAELVCEYWQCKVILHAKRISGLDIDRNKPENIMNAIRCLLSLKGNKNEGISYARMRPDISTYTLEPLTVEVAALFYASCLFYGNNDFALAVILVENDNRQYNTQRTIDRAYELYNTWYEKILKIGLERARAIKLDPLENSEIRWY
jgi:hypothetical protein